MATKALQSKYICSERPYSDLELENLKQILYKKIFLSDKVARHEKCGHFYKVKKNSKKEKSIIESGDNGNCSICWKFYNTPKEFKHTADSLIQSYLDSCCYIETGEEKYTHYTYELEKTFYEWLYKNF